MEVTLKLTRNGWTWTVSKDGKEIARHEMRVDTTGARGVGKGDIYDRLPEHPELAEAIDEKDELKICRHLW